MFIANYPLKSFVQKAIMFLQLPMTYGTLHPYRALQKRALSETMDFIVKDMPEAVSFDTPRELMDFAIKSAKVDGIVAEFGVNQGGTINFIGRKLPKHEIHGFDSFEGLPESWSGNQMEAGSFNNGGRMPKVPANVQLHKGWFSDSLPKWSPTNKDKPIALLHVDCDLYSSTVTIFDHLEKQIVPGTVIVFDEYFNYPAWQVHEHKAFREFLARTGRSCRYTAYSFQQVVAVME
jgi:Macrocin-O-methyltransferase (TylF)